MRDNAGPAAAKRRIVHLSGNRCAHRYGCVTGTSLVGTGCPPYIIRCRNVDQPSGRRVGIWGRGPQM